MPERVRALPARWVAVASGGIVVVVVVATVLVVGGGGDRDAQPGSEPAGRDDTTVSPVSAPGTSGGPTSGVPRPPTTTGAPGDEYEFDPNTEVPGVVARPIPEDPDDAVPPTTLAPPPWAASTRITAGGHVGVEVGCVRDGSVQALDEFLAARVGPVLGWDYQHVYPLGGDRYLWLFQDTFLDHRGVVNNLGNARFVHNAALVQDGNCFELLHRGSADRPAPFEVGDGAVDIRTRWFWPMGGELVGDQLWVFWAEM